MSCNYIGLINEYSQKKKLPLPTYQLQKEGESHIPLITCTIFFNNKSFTETACKIKTAKQMCAQQCVKVFKIEEFLHGYNQDLSIVEHPLSNNLAANSITNTIRKSVRESPRESPIEINNRFEVQLLSKNATLPERMGRSAGYDLASAEDCIVKSATRRVVKTDIAIKVPSNCYGRIAPRSGLSLNKCIDIAGGVIDEDYTGNVGVIVCNNSNTDFSVLIGQRIAQLILENISTPPIVSVKTLTQTTRGSNGFGSTGV